jgi:uncharacterized membrane protein YoaK (UPF0700 family)
VFAHHIRERLSVKTILQWTLLCLNGGYINAGGFLLTGRFVSHVTGFATLFGTHLAEKDLRLAFEMLSVPLFFLLGSFIAGVLVDRENKTQSPRFDLVMGLSAICLGIVSSGIFKSSQNELGMYVVIALLCLASGLQNAAISFSSEGSVRTTHLSGTVTDLGLGLARVFTRKTNSELIRNTRLLNWIRFGCFVAFAVGGTIGATMVLKYGQLCFVIPMLVSAYAAWKSKYSELRKI